MSQKVAKEFHFTLDFSSLVAEYYLKFIATNLEPHHSWLWSVNRLAKGKLKAKLGLEITFQTAVGFSDIFEKWRSDKSKSVMDTDSPSWFDRSINPKSNK